MRQFVGNDHRAQRSYLWWQKAKILLPNERVAFVYRQDFSAGGGWRVAGGGWRVAGDGWRVVGGGWRVTGGGLKIYMK